VILCILLEAKFKAFLCVCVAVLMKPGHEAGEGFVGVAAAGGGGTVGAAAVAGFITGSGVSVALFLLFCDLRFMAASNILKLLLTLAVVHGYTGESS